MTGLEFALYARSHLAWAAMYDRKAEDAVEADQADAAAVALAGGLECRWLARHAVPVSNDAHARTAGQDEPADD